MAAQEQNGPQMDSEQGLECHVVMRAYGDLAKDEEGEVIGDEAIYTKTEVQGGMDYPFSHSHLLALPFKSFGCNL